jgi:hypothetical protein
MVDATPCNQLIRQRFPIESRSASQNEVAIEFTEPAPRFWHIDFPPDDWKLIQD